MNLGDSNDSRGAQIQCRFIDIEVHVDSTSVSNSLVPIIIGLSIIIIGILYILFNLNSTLSMYLHVFSFFFK